MAFCSKCGNRLEDGARFCAQCGSPAGQTGSENARKQEYAGGIRKCPNCGEPLQAFQATCPLCGHDITGMAAAASVREFFDKYSSTSNNALKLELINSYPIPNTKEDILEFALLASQQIKSEYDAQTSKTNPFTVQSFLNPYGLNVHRHTGIFRSFKQAFTGINKTVDNDELLSAWKEKLEQIVRKAKLIFADDSKNINQIMDIVSATHQAEQKLKQKQIASKRHLTILIIAIPIFSLGMSGIIDIINSKTLPSEDKERARLTQLMKEIQTDIDTENYEAAELKLPELQWQYSETSDYQQTNVEEWKKKHSILENKLKARTYEKNK